MLLQDHLEELDQTPLLGQFFSSMPGKMLLFARKLFDKFKDLRGLVIGITHRSGCVG